MHVYKQVYKKKDQRPLSQKGKNYINHIQSLMNLFLDLNDNI